MLSLPTDILPFLVTDLNSWRAMLVVPAFAHWTFTDDGHRAAMQFIRPLITTTKSYRGHTIKYSWDGFPSHKLTTIYLFRGASHTLCDIPQSHNRGQYTWYRFGRTHHTDGSASHWSHHPKIDIQRLTWKEFNG